MAYQAALRWEIEDLYSRYNHAVDRFQADEFVELFAPDGYFESSSRHEGREALREFVAARKARLADAEVTNQQHWTSNLVLRIRGNHVSAECYLMRIGTDRATGNAIVLGTGKYIDELVQIDGIWLFASRKVQQ